ncbi:MAG: hypothetical protein ACI8PB_001218 [Desulforhopalus sp.]
MLNSTESVMSNKACKTSVNIKKNRLIITVAGKITKKSIDSLYTEIRFCVADLKPGFDVITDLSACNLAAVSGVPTFRKITNHLIISKVGRVVRVIDETKIIKKQLFNITARSQSYNAEIFHSLEAAEEYFSESDESKELCFRQNGQHVDYIFDEASGIGEVEFLSIGECKINSATLSLAIGSQITLTVKFENHEDLLDQFEVSAEIIWVEGDDFGAQFIDVDEEMKDRLWKRLVHESQRELL